MNIPAMIDDIAVAVGDEAYAIGDYPLSHVRGLLREYDGEIGEVIDRLTCDGLTPAEIVAGMGR